MKKIKHAPTELNKPAAFIVEQTTNEDRKEEQLTKNQTAFESGRLEGLKSGKARAKKLAASQRRLIAIKAAHARWKKK